MNTGELATPLAAFVAGLATSVHCTLMCGPLGCALLGSRAASPAEWRRSTLCYHAARLTSYAAFGALLGAIGRSAAGFFHAPISRALPWAMALLFLMLAFGWERKIPQLPLISRWLFKLRLRTAALPRNQVAILLGAVTPFLPCGPLYLMLGVALVSGAALTGAQVMASFALGTIPLFALAQVSALHWQGSLAPRAQQWTRRGLALGAALLIGGRAVLHSDSLLAPVKCLLCH